MNNCVCVCVPLSEQEFEHHHLTGASNCSTSRLLTWTGERDVVLVGQLPGGSDIMDSRVTIPGWTGLQSLSLVTFWKKIWSTGVTSYRLGLDLALLIPSTSSVGSFPGFLDPSQ